MKKNQAWCVIGNDGLAQAWTINVNRATSIEEFVRWKYHRAIPPTSSKEPWKSVVRARWDFFRRRLGYRCVKVQIAEVEK